MTFARVRLVFALTLFTAWLGWLAAAVYEARHAPDRAAVLSQSQLVAADTIVVADVDRDPDDGLPSTHAKVTEVIRGAGLKPGDSIDVLNLKSALPPGAGQFPGVGKYLLPLVSDGKTYRVSGLARSPGYEPAAGPRPRIYPWSDDTRAQLRGIMEPRP